VRGWWELIFEAMRTTLSTDGLLLIDSTTCNAHRVASGAAHSTATAEAFGRSHGGMCSTLHACANRAGGGGQMPRKRNDSNIAGGGTCPPNLRTGLEAP